MISTIPVMIIFFSSLLKIEKTNFYQVLGVIFSMLGVIVIVTQLNGEKILELSFNKGDLSIIIAMLSWALYSALLKKKKIRIITNITFASYYKFRLNFSTSNLFN